MTYEYDLLVFVGRFQPFHNQHKRIIDIALQKSKNVLVLVGSAGKARTIRNPFTFDERKSMIRDAFHWFSGEQNRLIIEPLYDKTYNDAAWIKQVQDIVKNTTLAVINNYGFQIAGYNDAKVGLIGASKDNTSYYLKMFPQYRSVNVEIEADVHATDIRNELFEDETVFYAKQLPENVVKWLNEFTRTDEYDKLTQEFQFIRKYKKQWEAAPYPVKHLTVDAVVEQSGHVLLVRRRHEPGKNLFALPGGHLDLNESLQDGVLRELREETKIKVPEPVLRGSIVNQRMFDDPHRSTLGRVITFAQHIKLPDSTTLPKVKGSDDADKAFWKPISQLKEQEMFDDHYHIISHFLGL